MNDASRLRRLLLRLPALSASAASNHQLIQDRLQYAFDALASGASSGVIDAAAIADLGHELNELQRMLDNEREVFETFAHSSADEGRAPGPQPGATYLALYGAAIALGDFAGAAPLFTQYCACNDRPADMEGRAPKARWRGPLNRQR